MTEPARGRLLLLVDWAAGALAFLLAVVVLNDIAGPIATRLDFPGDLEWMEGATLVSAERLRDGLAIYGEPAPEYIPFIYPPLYAWLVAKLSAFFPLGYALGRSVSVAGILLAAAAAVFGARRAGANPLAAFAAAGLLAACWDDAGSFYDLVRTDSISLALLGWAIVLGNGPTPRWSVASGLVLAVAFTAKQHAALVGIPIGLWTLFAHGWRRAALFAAASAGPALLFTAGMMLATEGRYFTWIATVATEHEIVGARLFPGAQLEIWGALPWTTSAVLLAPLWLRRAPYWAAVTGTILVVVSLMRGHTGGYLNVLMPAFWVQAVLPFVAASAVATSPRAWLRVASRIAASLVIALQLAHAHLRADFARFVPTDKDRAAAEALVDELRALPDPILMPHAPWYARLAGKRVSFGLITLWDIDHPDGTFRPGARAIDEQIAAGYFPVAVVPDDKLGHGLKAYFARQRSITTKGLGTRTGWPVRLRTVWTYKGSDPTPTGS